MTGPWTGYELPTEPASFDALVEGFEWQIPDRYNIATHVLSGDADATALRHAPDSSDPNTAITLTYGDLDTASAAVADAFAARGIGRGDHVALCLPQCPELLVCHLAVYRLGGVVVPASMLLGDEAFIHVLNHSEAALLVVDSRRWAAAESVATSLPTDVIEVDVGTEPEVLGGLNSVVGADVAHGDATASADCNEVTMAETAPDDPGLLLYTSGTTSDPKGVVQGHQYLLGSLPGYHCWFGLFDESSVQRARLWTPSEWAWAGALFDVVFPTLALGGTVVSSVRRSGFDPESALSLVRTQKITNAFLPPTALRAVRNETDPTPADVPALDTVMCGGEHLPTALTDWAESNLGITVNESYGQTEANALVGESKSLGLSPTNGIGRPYPGHEIAIVDEDGERRSTGSVGEIAVVRPDPVVMQSYLGDPAATDAVLGDELLTTGDVGRRSDDGTLEHLGRKDDLIITSGYRVSPLEVEEVLASYPAVAAVLVSSEPDPERGHRVVATVVPNNGATGDEVLKARLQDAVADVLGPYKRPRRIEFVDELPTTRTDKTDRSSTNRE